MHRAARGSFCVPRAGADTIVFERAGGSIRQSVKIGKITCQLSAHLQLLCGLFSLRPASILPTCLPCQPARAGACSDYQQWRWRWPRQILRCGAQIAHTLGGLIQLASHPNAAPSASASVLTDAETEMG